MLEDILVTVIVPVYKVEPYVGYTLQDICDQTYKNLQIIVIDDGSPDRCGEICDEYARKDHRIEVVHTENRGLSSARNYGIDHAKGKYLYFLDSDDRIHPECIERLLSIAEREECDIVQAHCISFTDDGVLPKLIEDDRISIYSNYEMCKHLLRNTVAGATIIQNKLYRSELFEGKNHFPDGRIHEDVALTYHLYWDSARIAVTEAPLFYYRSFRTGSITHAKFNLARLDGLIAAKERYMFFQEIGETQLYAYALLCWCDVAIFAMKSLKKSDIEGKENYLREIGREFRRNYFMLLKEKDVRLKSKLRVTFSFIKKVLCGV